MDAMCVMSFSTYTIVDLELYICLVGRDCQHDRLFLAFCIQRRSNGIVVDCTTDLRERCLSIHPGAKKLVNCFFAQKFTPRQKFERTRSGPSCGARAEANDGDDAI